MNIARKEQYLKMHWKDADTTIIPHIIGAFNAYAVFIRWGYVLKVLLKTKH